MDEQRSRRSVLAAGAAIGLGGLSGCLRFISGGDDTTPTQADTTDISDSDGDGVIDSEDYAPRDPDVQRAAQVRPATTAQSQPGATTAEPTTSTATNAAFSDGYERTELTNLVATNEPLDRWEITDGIDGRSLKGEGGSDSKGPGARVIYDPDRFGWGGDRKISVQYKTDTSLSKRHAQLLFFDNGVEWQIAATEALNRFRLRWQFKGDGAIQNVDTAMESGTVHEISATIKGDTITAAYDGEELIEYTHTEEIGPGTVGFGVGDGRRTWFDNLRVQPL